MCDFLLQSFVSLHTSSWRQMNMCALLGRNSRFAAPHTIPTLTTMSPGNIPLRRSVAYIWVLGSLIGETDYLYALSLYVFLQIPTIEEKVRSSGENRLDIQSILTIPAVNLADTGNISCIGTNEAGVNSSTTYLLVVGKPRKQSHWP